MNIHVLVIIFLVICILVLDVCIYKLKSKIIILERKNDDLNTCRTIQKNIETVYGRQLINFPCSMKQLHGLAREKLLKRIEMYIEYNDELGYMSDGQIIYKCTASLSVVRKDR